MTKKKFRSAVGFYSAYHSFLSAGFFAIDDYFIKCGELQSEQDCRLHNRATFAADYSPSCNTKLKVPQALRQAQGKLYSRALPIRTKSRRERVPEESARS